MEWLLAPSPRGFPDWGYSESVFRWWRGLCSVRPTFEMPAELASAHACLAHSPSQSRRVVASPHRSTLRSRQGGRAAGRWQTPAEFQLRDSILRIASGGPARHSCSMVDARRSSVSPRWTRYSRGSTLFDHGRERQTWDPRHPCWCRTQWWTSEWGCRAGRALRE